MTARLFARAFRQVIDNKLSQNLALRHYRCAHSGPSFLKSKGRYVGGILGSIVGLGGVSFAYSTHRALLAEAITHQHPVSRKVIREGDTSGIKLTLYQYISCPFCCKVRSMLDAYGFSYDIVEVNPVKRTEIKWSEYKKVPVVVMSAPGEGEMQLNDSTVIISILESYLADPSVSLEKLKTYYPALTGKDEKGKETTDYPNKYFIMFGDAEPNRSKKELSEEREWRKWADDYLIHAIAPNVYRTPRETLQAFRYYDTWGQYKSVFSPFERKVVMYTGATVMYILGKVLKRRHNLKDDVRASMYELCDEWVAAVGTRKFMGGDTPNLADLSVFGALRSFGGCDCFEDVMKNTNIEDWYKNMEHAANTAVNCHKLDSIKS